MIEIRQRVIARAFCFMLFVVFMDSRESDFSIMFSNVDGFKKCMKC